MRHSLYKYYSEQKWADAFLDGELLFRSLSYFRNYEDKNVRGDQNEGTSIFRPEGGLIIHNQTQGKTFTLPNHTFRAAVNQEEIFVFCLSRSLNDNLCKRFDAVVYVEILNIEVFCTRIQNELPPEATYPGPPGRTRIGQRVEYYKETEDCNPRWALPNKIATSKLDSFAWQDEYRLVFCLTDALQFEKVDTKIMPGNAEIVSPTVRQQDYFVKTRPLPDICKLHKF